MARNVTKSLPFDHKDLANLLAELAKDEHFGGRVGQFNAYGLTDFRKMADYVAGVCTFEELIKQLCGGTGAHFHRPEDGYDPEEDGEEVHEVQVRSRITGLGK